MKILIEPASTPPVFRFSAEAGGPVNLIEIRITEVGQVDPSWWLVHHDGWIEEAVDMHILTREEAERAGIPVTRDVDGELGRLADSIGFPINQLRYGEVPDGFRQHGQLLELVPNHLYQLLAVGSSLGELEFYG
jgi:hypothetical protein